MHEPFFDSTAYKDKSDFDFSFLKPSEDPEIMTTEEFENQINSDLETIGAKITGNPAAKLLDADLPTRIQVWNGIYKKLGGGPDKTFEEYVKECEIQIEETSLRQQERDGLMDEEALEALKRLHDFLNFDTDAFLKEIGVAD